MNNTKKSKIEIIKKIISSPNKAKVKIMGEILLKQDELIEIQEIALKNANFLLNKWLKISFIEQVLMYIVGLTIGMFIAGVILR